MQTMTSRIAAAKDVEAIDAAPSLIAIKYGMIISPANASEDNMQLAASLQAELMNLGFILNEEAFQSICHASRGWITSYYNAIIPALRKQMGADRNYRAFYVNFPTQVMEMSELGLFLNAVIHYLSAGTWEPPQELKDRGIHFEKTEFKVVKRGTEDEFNRIFTKLVSINQSLTENDKATVDWFITNRREQLVLPAAIPFKETLCTLAAEGIDVPVKTPTDVLRIAVHLSGGDISLPALPTVTVKNINRGYGTWFFERLKESQAAARETFKFKKFKRDTRRRLVTMLSKTNMDVAEMQRHLGRWLRLGEILHPSEFKQFPQVTEAFRLLRNQHSPSTKIRTFAAQVTLAFRENWHKGVDVLVSRPGEFARRLDWMLRTPIHESSYVLDAFARCGDKISMKVLFELWNHFEARSRPGSPRTIIIKGKKSKMKEIPALPPLDPKTVVAVKDTIVSLIKRNLSKLPPIGKVWIDERLKEVPIPFAMRSVNTAVKTYVRGTRIPFRSDAKVIRPFIHWFDEHGEEDLDLSVGLFNAELQPVTHISFTNLREQALGCCHSGDIRRRKGACAEYVDIPIEQCLKGSVRYALVQVHNYQQRPMHSLKECVFGLMERENAVAGEIFIPKTISNCMGLANESSTVMVCILDLLEKKYIWADIEASRAMAVYENTSQKSAEVLRSLINNTKMSVYDLLLLHAEARGSVVASKDAAKVVFNWEDFVTDYSKVASYMGA
jgi:hypothetical protein